jgi:hypothetical protein
VPRPTRTCIRVACEDDLFGYIVMEFCAGRELFDRVVAKGHYTESATTQFITTTAARWRIIKV